MGSGRRRECTSHLNSNDRTSVTIAIDPQSPAPIECGRGRTGHDTWAAGQHTNRPVAIRRNYYLPEADSVAASRKVRLSYRTPVGSPS
ncbi:hypothetical protein Poly51_41470 [Rubripirellula tenax]|uniref:Uncharacterized protein n=1 Tax=Rubripirellula tenax TaxID=2528015 RepID=A0A5C6ER35_9BACT|nr:hypothetical protein Poly51_41470 [Rubripirellula tenax]